MNSDTDGDFLSDGSELAAGIDTDPLDPETDGDGVLDGNETYTTTVENETRGVAVSLTGTGDVASETTLDDTAPARFTGGRAPTEAAASEFVAVEADAPFESATVTLDYDESRVQSSESNLSVYRVDDAGAYHRLNSTVDPGADRVTATTSEFSVLVVLDAWAAMQYVQAWNQPADPGCVTDAVDFDFDTDAPVVLDSNESVEVNGRTWHCVNQPYEPPYSDTPTSGACRVADGWAEVREETNRRRFLEHTLDLPDVESGESLFVNTSLRASIESEWANSAVTLVLENRSGQEFDVFRLEQDTVDDTKTIEANPRVNVTQWAGETVTVSFRADGRWTYYFEDTWASIAVDYLTFEKRTGGGVDSDGDGISDAQEAAGVPLANTTRAVQLDPNDADTDGDGLEDGEEVHMDDFQADQDLSDADVIHFPGYAWSSDPSTADTDEDVLDDQAEQRGWRIPVDNSSCAAPCRYRYNYTVGPDPGEMPPPAKNSTKGMIHVTSSPAEADTDEDGLTDGQER